MMAKDLISKIDSALDLLIRNADAFKEVDLSDLTETEIAAFQKTQESLLQHLLHVDAKLQEAKTKKPLQINKPVLQAIRERSLKIRRAKEAFAKTVQGATKPQPLFHKRRFKRFLEEDAKSLSRP